MFVLNIKIIVRIQINLFSLQHF